MEENKKTVKKEETGNTNQKAYWVIGIALIVFLILVLGSVIGLKITRDGLNNVLDNDLGGNNSQNDSNYELSEDGSMVSTNEGIKNAEIVVGGRKFSNFSIEEKEGTSTIKVDIENVTEEALEAGTFSIKLLDVENNIVAEYSMLATEQEAGAKTTALTSLVKSCINASKIEISLISAE